MKCFKNLKLAFCKKNKRDLDNFVFTDESSFIYIAQLLVDEFQKKKITLM